MTTLQADLLLFAPEVLLACLGLLLVVGCVSMATPQAAMRMGAWGTGIGVITALLLLAVLTRMPLGGTAFNGMLIHDTYAITMKVVVLGAALIAILLSPQFWQHEHDKTFEYYLLLLFAVIGMMLMISAADFLMLYVGLELQSLALYVLASIQRDNTRGNEAGLKYFLLGALSSGILLYGISLLYGATGTLAYAEVRTYIVILASESEPSLLLITALALILSGIAFKISAVPFHMWTPDVYQGAPTAVTAFFAVAPKVAALAVLARLLALPFAGLEDAWQQIIMLLAVASMVFAAFAALRQTSLKRLLAYSAIGHVGYALVALLPASISSTSAFIFYIFTYAIMNIGAFAFLLGIRREGRAIEDISDLAGLAKTNPASAYALAILMLSLAGIPIFAGFFAKLAVFQAAIAGEFYIVAVIGVLASVVSAFYYLRVCKVMFFDEPLDAADKFTGRAVPLVLLLSATISTIFLAFPGAWLQHKAAIAAASLYAGF